MADQPVKEIGQLLAEGRTNLVSMLSVFCSPSRYTQGKNATAVLGAEMAGLGLRGPALLVAGRSALRLLSAAWKQSFNEAGIAHAVHPFNGECTLAEIDRVKQAAQHYQAQVIVGAGGGKVLDTARAVVAALSLPVVNCPTVASSDAPCSALSVIYSEEGVVQEFRIYGKNPDLVLVDTQVIAQSPPRHLVAGMGDALATWFEAKTCALGHVKNMRGGTGWNIERPSVGGQRWTIERAARREAVHSLLLGLTSLFREMTCKLCRERVAWPKSCERG